MLSIDLLCPLFNGSSFLYLTFILFALIINAYGLYNKRILSGYVLGNAIAIYFIISLTLSLSYFSEEDVLTNAVALTFICLWTVEIALIHDIFVQNSRHFKLSNGKTSMNNLLSLPTFQDQDIKKTAVNIKI